MRKFLLSNCLWVKTSLIFCLLVWTETSKPPGSWVPAKSLQSYLTLRPIDCRLPGSSVHGIPQARILEGVPCPPPGDIADPGSNSCLLCLLQWQLGSLPPAPPGKLEAPQLEQYYGSPTSAACQLQLWGFVSLHDHIRQLHMIKLSLWERRDILFVSLQILNNNPII